MLLPLALLAALHAPVDSVPGKWQIKGDIMGNPLDETCTITQTGTSLGGSCTNSNGGPYEVTGEAKDGKVTFKHGGAYQGQELTITYSATFAAPMQLKGTVDVQPYGVSGEFTAAPATPAAAPTKP